MSGDPASGRDVVLINVVGATPTVVVDPRSRGATRAADVLDEKRIRAVSPITDVTNLNDKDVELHNAIGFRTGGHSVQSVIFRLTASVRHAAAIAMSLWRRMLAVLATIGCRVTSSSSRQALRHGLRLGGGRS